MNILKLYKKKLYKKIRNKLDGKMQVIMCVLVSGCAAATSIGYVGQYGNEHAGWMPICDHFHAFCHKITTAVALGYISFIFFFFLTIVSATTVAPTLHL